MFTSLIEYVQGHFLPILDLMIDLGIYIAVVMTGVLLIMLSGFMLKFTGYALKQLVTGFRELCGVFRKE